MARQKQGQLDQIQFENVSYWNDKSDPVLSNVDLQLPMDQTVIVSSSNPLHAVQLLEILAGRREPKSGHVKWLDEENSRNAEKLNQEFHEVVASYFESTRPDPNQSVKQLLHSFKFDSTLIDEVVRHFDLQKFLNKKFKDISYEMQKLLLLVIPTLRMPQMLILEDPAVGVKEPAFLNYLDWIQLWQRRGHLRHIYLTNNHPAAARHLDASILHVEDGLIYFEEPEVIKKIVHF